MFELGVVLPKAKTSMKKILRALLLIVCAHSTLMFGAHADRENKQAQAQKAQQLAAYEFDSFDTWFYRNDFKPENFKSCLRKYDNFDGELTVGKFKETVLRDKEKYIVAAIQKLEHAVTLTEIEDQQQLKALSPYYLIIYPKPKKPSNRSSGQQAAT